MLLCFEKVSSDSRVMSAVTSVMAPSDIETTPLSWYHAISFPNPSVSVLLKEEALYAQTGGSSQRLRSRLRILG